MSISTPSKPIIQLTSRFGYGATHNEKPPKASWEIWLTKQSKSSSTIWSTQTTADIVKQELQYRAQAKELKTQSRLLSEAAAAALAQEHQAKYDMWRSVVLETAANIRFARAIESDSSFVERLVHFWSNHLCVDRVNDTLHLLAGAYEDEAIRPYVFGQFEELVLSATLHPAMLIYLNQDRSTGPNSDYGKSNSHAGINENLAREILELHTVSINGGYSQTDIIEFAKALTGWRVAGLNPWPKAQSVGTAQFHTRLHEPGARIIMGRSFSAGQADQSKAIIQWLSNHAATAQHVAQKLAIHFVSDSPPSSVVARLKTAFLSTKGDLMLLYETLIGLEETWAQKARKLKTPWEWAVSIFRHTGARLGSGFSTVEMCEQLGQPVWQPGSPAGWSDKSDDWASADNMVRRINFAYAFTDHMFAALGKKRAPAKRVFGLDLEFPEGSMPKSFSAKEADELMLFFLSPEFLYRT